MISACPQSRSTKHRASLSNSGELFTSDLDFDLTPGSFNDEHIVRGLITVAIRTCGKSRQVIAEEMSVLLGTTVTKRALDSYTSESSEQNRFPAQYTRAFCHVTGDWQLFRCVTERAGLHVISKAEQKLLELGRQMLLKERAEASIAKLREELSGVSL